MTLQRYEVIELLLKYNPTLIVVDPKGRTIDELLIQYKNPKLDIALSLTISDTLSSISIVYKFNFPD
jgi:hypothetical protein